MSKVHELKNQRAEYLAEAEKALDEGRMEDYKAAMDKATAMNDSIKAYEKLDAEARAFDGGIAHIKGVTGGTIDRNDKEYKDAFFYAITNGITPKNGRNVAEVAPLYNALTESGGSPTGADGGFLVPTSFNNLIVEIRRQLVALSEYVTVETVTAPTGWRAVDAAPSAGFTKIDEMGTVVQDDQPVFTKVTYSLEKYGLIVPVSSELLNDNTVGLEAYLARWFAKKGVITENAAIIDVLDETLTGTALTSGSEIVELTSALNKELDPAISAAAIVLTNQSGYDALCQLVDTNGRTMIQPDPTTGQPKVFRSHEVVVLSDDELANDATNGAPVYVGDLKAFESMFVGKSLEVASTNIGGSAWTTDSVEVRGIMRIDVEAMDTAAAVKKYIAV